VRSPAVDLAAHFRNHGLHAAPAASPAMIAALGSSRVFDVTDHGCSCSLYPSGPHNMDSEIARRAAKYARKGWSDAKIARALESLRQCHSRAKPPRSAMFLKAVLDLAQVAPVYMLAHDYTGRHYEDPFVVGPPITVSETSLDLANYEMPFDSPICVDA
jgi:hypothetical protein